MMFLKKWLVFREKAHPNKYLQQQLRCQPVALPLLTLSLLFVLATGSGFDQWLANWFYQLQGGRWQLQSFWLTEAVLHQGVRQLNQLILLLLLCVWLMLLARSSGTSLQRALGMLLLSLLLSFSCIALLKKLIPMECPWDLQQFGGDQAFIGLLNFRPATMAPNQCFPAGHASIGYGWMAIYYFCLVMSPATARKALCASIGLGLLLGFTQQLRGAHFISHDIATAAICWLIASLTFRWFYPLLATPPLLHHPMPVAPGTTLTSHTIHRESSDV